MHDGGRIHKFDIWGRPESCVGHLFGDDFESDGGLKEKKKLTVPMLPQLQPAAD